MKFQMLFQVALAVAVAGCGATTTRPDGGSRDMSTGGGFDLAVQNDFAIGNNDFAAGPDMTGGCIQVATWPNVGPFAGYDPADNLTFVASSHQSAEPINLLAMEDWHLMASETYPKMLTAAATDRYSTCDICGRFYEQCTQAAGCGALYFAQGGNVTITKADTNELVGRMTATATNLKLVEWDFMNDAAVPNGKCYVIGSASWDVPWDERTDMAGLDLKPAVTDLAGLDLVSAGDMALACTPVINEVQTAGTAGVTGAASREFVEIFNPCANSVVINGWKITYRSRGNNVNSANADTPLFTFPTTTLAAGAYVVVGGTSFTPKDHTLSNGLSDEGGAVALRDALGNRVDSVSYANLTVTNNLTEGTTPAPNPPAAKSIGRLPVNGKDTNNNALDFAVTTTVTPKAANQ